MMKKRLAMKIANRPIDKLSPRWKRTLYRGKDEHLSEALKIVEAYGK